MNVRGGRLCGLGFWEENHDRGHIKARKPPSQEKYRNIPSLRSHTQGSMRGKKMKVQGVGKKPES